MKKNQNTAPLLAFISRDEDSGEAEILFYQSEAAAVDHAGPGLERADYFDKYAGQGGVPAQVLMQEHDWWCDCWQCGTRLNTGEVYDSDGEERTDIDLVFSGHAVYCNTACHQAHTAEVNERKRIKAALVDGLLARFPGVTIGDVLEWALPPQVHFSFPGMKYGAHWVLGDDKIFCHPHDVDAWLAFKATLPA